MQKNPYGIKEELIFKFIKCRKMSRNVQEYDSFEQKKVQSVKGSFYIYLPKALCRRYEIEKSKKVFMKQLEDDSLILKFNSKSAYPTKSFIIDLDYDYANNHEKLGKEKYLDYLFNQYLTAYIIGFNTVIFRKRTKIPMIMQNRIHKMTRKLYGMVVISETVKEIVVEEHFEEIDIKILNRQLLSKIYLMINNYIELVENLEELENKNEIIDELIQQDDQIDEHRYAVERYVHQILRHPSLGQIVNISAVECLHYSEMTRLIERIGDHVVKLAVLLKKQEIVEKDFVLEQLDRMWNIYITIQDYFERTDTLKLWILVQDIKEYASNIKDMIYENHPDTEYLIPIRRVCNICGDIAEIRINDILSHTQSNKGKK